MPARESSATERALRRIGKPDKSGVPITAYRAAKDAGIALSTIYRAVARQRARERVEEIYREREGRA